MQRRSKHNNSKTTFATIVFVTLFSTFFSPESLLAQEYAFEHSDCKIRVKEYKNEELKNLAELAKDKLEQKKFKLQNFIENQRLLPGDLYFDVRIDRPKERLYTACIVSIFIKVSKRNTPSKSDKILYKKSINRRVPRITLSGSERCRMALQDAFIHIPLCREIGYSGERK